MREINGWKFLGFYGVIYVIFMLFMVITYPLAQEYAKPFAALVFPIAGNNSLLKNIIVDTLMYWGMVLIYSLVIEKIKLKF